MIRRARIPRTLKAVVASATVALALLASAACQADRSIAFSDQQPLTAQVNARPARQSELSAVSVDLEITDARSGVITLDVERASLGRTSPAYAWDWKGATADDVSILDITKQAQQDGVVKAWDVDVATPGTMRVKVWHDWGSEWRVTAKSPAMSMVEGLNHFVLDPALPVRAGDYVGLYVMSGRMKLVAPQGLLPAPDLRDQSAVNLTWATARSLQYNMPGDVGCVAKPSAQPAPNPDYAFTVFFGRPSAPVVAVPDSVQPASFVPLTIADLEKEVPADAVYRSWEVQAEAVSQIRLKVWRRAGAEWRVVGQSAPERTRPGLNAFALTPALPVKQGDILGFFTDYPQSGTSTAIPFPVQVDTCGKTAAGKVYVNGDFNGSVAGATMAHDPVGHYAFRAFTTDVGDSAPTSVTFEVQPGRKRYRLPIAAQGFRLDESLAVTLHARPGTSAIVHSTGRWLRAEYVGDGPGGLSGWAFDVLMLGLSFGGAAAILRRQVSRWSLICGGLVIVATAAIWVRWVDTSSPTALGPAIILMLGLPGFLILELGMPRLASRLDTLERPPLLFGLSCAAWTVMAAVAYRAQWRTATFVTFVMVVIATGLGALAWRRWSGKVATPLADPATDPEIASATRAYQRLLIGVILSVMIIVGWRAQFQGTGADTFAHLAGYRKVADSATLVGGNPLLGPGYAYVPNYAANPWYLVFGLVARLAHQPASVPQLYVYLTSLLTGLVFLAFYVLVKTFTSEPLAAVLGTLLSIGPWIFGYTQEWKVFHSYFFEFLGYQSTFVGLIIFPLLTAYTLRFVRDGVRPLAETVALLSVAAMGMHAQYFVWVPILIATSLVVSVLPKSGASLRVSTVALVAFIGCTAVALAYITVTGPLADKPIAWNIDQEIGLWVFNAGPHGLWRPTAKLISQDPIGIFDHTAEVVGLALLLILGSRRWVIEKLSIRLTRDGVTASGVGRLGIGAAVILVMPWVVAYTPPVSTSIFRLLHSSIPIYRIGGANEVLALVAVFGPVAVAWSALIRSAHTPRARRLVHVVPLLLLTCTMGIVSLSPSGRQSLLAPLANHGWYPSLFDLPNDSLYRGLSRLEPGVVSVATEEGELIAALTPHYVVSVRQFRIGDSTLTPQRAADNDLILSLSAPPEQIRQALDRTHCRYVVVPKGSPALSSFRTSSLFSEAFTAEADVVFKINGAQ